MSLKCLVATESAKSVCLHIQDDSHCRQRAEKNLSTNTIRVHFTVLYKISYLSHLEHVNLCIAFFLFIWKNILYIIQTGCKSSRRLKYIT